MIAHCAVCAGERAIKVDSAELGQHASAGALRAHERTDLEREFRGGRECFLGKNQLGKRAAGQHGREHSIICAVLIGGVDAGVQRPGILAAAAAGPRGPGMRGVA